MPLILLLVCMLLPATMRAADEGDTLRRWGGGIQLHPATAIVMDRYQSKWMDPAPNFSVAAELRHASLPADSNAYDADYGYPVMGIGVKYSRNHRIKMHRQPDESWPYIEEVDYDSQMGNSLAFYGFFSRPFFRNRHWEADYTFNLGVGYSHSKYNLHNSIDNELIGSRWLIYFGAGLHLAYQVDPEWSFRAGVEYWHLSNGAINRPNKGANFVGPSLSVCYTPYYEASLPHSRRQHIPHKPYLFADITGGVGYRTLYEDWKHTQFELKPDEPGYRTDHFKHYLTYTFQGSLMCRYARRWASGVEADVFYGPYASDVEAYDKRAGRDDKHSPWSLGLGVKHEAYYRRLKLSMSLGWYLYREMGHTAKRSEQPFYERIGVQYLFPCLHGMGVGFSVKAHMTKADYTELVVSCPIRL